MDNTTQPMTDPKQSKLRILELEYLQQIKYWEEQSELAKSDSGSIGLLFNHCKQQELLNRKFLQLIRTIKEII